MRVFACMASTLDGKIGPANTERFVALGSQHDLNHLVALRDQADAVLFGAKTFRAWPKIHKGTDPRRKLHHFIMSQSLDLDTDSELIQDSSIPLTVLTSSLAENHSLPSHVELSRVPEQNAIAAILDHIHSKALGSLLVEGGGQIIGQLIEARALQELYLTVVPNILGQASAPDLLGGHDISVRFSLDVLENKQLGDETYLHLKFNYL